MMKITTKQIRQIIIEELQNVVTKGLQESGIDESMLPTSPGTGSLEDSFRQQGVQRILNMNYGDKHLKPRLKKCEELVSSCHQTKRPGGECYEELEICAGEAIMSARKDRAAEKKEKAYQRKIQDRKLELAANALGFDSLADVPEDLLYQVWGDHFTIK